MDTLGKRLHAKFLVYAHWFMSIRMSQIKDHSISVDQSIYATSIVAKYLDTDTDMTCTKFYNTTLTSDTIFTKAGASTIDEKIEKLPREFNIRHRACIGSLLYFLSKIVDLSFSVLKLEKFNQTLVNYTLKS